MVTSHTATGEKTYDLSGIGLGEGLYCCSKYELEQLMTEIKEVLDERTGE